MNPFHRQSGAVRRLAPLILGLISALLISWSLAAAGPRPQLPTDPTDLPQVTAEPPLRTPATASCTETVLVHTFANSYYAPGYGQHSAAACPGPWSFVSLGVDVSVMGVQYDRLFDIYVGNVPMLSSSTSEPASEIPGAVTHWHIDTDVSRFAGLLASDQPITAILNNVNDSTYTGQYAVTLKLTYYATGAAAPAIVPPDYIGAVFDPGAPPYQSGPGDYGTSGYAGLGASNTSYTKTMTLPTNLLTLKADVYAEGHGACEEFWWGEPGQCGVGTPLRQAVLRIDGVIAGFAPVYPVLFTGGGGPGSWEPIPSPRAWHLYPYELDLTPFIGLLGDGKPHSFNIGIPDAAYSDPGDYWIVGATLLGTEDPVLLQTSGALTSAPVAASATESTTTDPTGTAILNFTASRDGSWSGYVVGSAGTVQTVVSNHLDLTTEAEEVVNSLWHWNTSSAVTAGSAAAVTTAASYTYKLTSAGIGGGLFGDTASFSVTGGANPSSSSYDLELVTVGAVDANVTEAETYNGSDSTGFCYQRIINASAGYVLSDQTSPVCLNSTTGSTTGGTTTGGTTTGGTTGGSTTGSTTGGTTGGTTTGGSTTGGTTTGGSTTGGTTGGTTTGGSGSSETVTATLTATPTSGTTPLQVAFDASGSSSSNGTAISSYTFYFGDGSASQTTSSPTLSFTYTAAGTFNAQVVATDANGYTAASSTVQITSTATVTVTGSGQAVAAMTVTPTSGSVPLTVQFDGSRSFGANGNAITTYTFDFGDGSQEISGSSATVSHVYTAAGTYNPTLSVTDSQGNTSAQKAMATVKAIGTGSGGGSGSPATASGSGGGAFGFATLLPMMMLALRRRRRH
jgi:PKD repeat protein